MTGNAATSTQMPLPHAKGKRQHMKSEAWENNYADVTTALDSPPGQAMTGNAATSTQMPLPQANRRRRAEY
eukprot:12158751-Heterocapsa_arctica.AAC.1